MSYTCILGNRSKFPLSHLLFQAKACKRVCRLETQEVVHGTSRSSEFRKPRGFWMHTLDLLNSKKKHGM